MKNIISILLIFNILTFNNCSDSNPYKQGKIYYGLYCANCHMENGEGLKGLIPPLAKADYLVKNRTELACIIRKGLKGPILVNEKGYGQQEMPGVSKLTDFEITNILNYISTSWGNQGNLWTVDEVREGLKNCE